MTNDVEIVYSVFNRLKDTSGTNDKIEILKEFSDNELIISALDFLFNTFIVTGLALKKINKDVSQAPETTLKSLSEAIAYLKSDENNSGKDVNIATIQKFIKGQKEEHQDFLKQFFTKTFKCGVTAKTVNKALGGIIPEFACQLAHSYEKYLKLIDGKTLFTLTTKLDGHRTIAVVDTLGETKFFTRKGNQIDGLYEIANNIKWFSDNGVLGMYDYNDGFVLDGEIIVSDLPQDKDKTFQETSKIIRKDGQKTGLTFHVFDLLPLQDFVNGESVKTYQKRRTDMRLSFSNNEYSNLKLVENLYSGYDVSKISKFLTEQVSNGEEGIMINLDTPYKNKRHNGLLKVKEFYTDDLLVVGMYEGEIGTKYEGLLGGIFVDYKGNIVKVGSGFTDEEREEYFKNPSSILDKIVEVQYFQETENQKNDEKNMRFPTYKRIRLDKGSEDVSYES